MSVFYLFLRKSDLGFLNIFRLPCFEVWELLGDQIYQALSLALESEHDLCIKSLLKVSYDDLMFPQKEANDIQS